MPRMDAIIYFGFIIENNRFYDTESLTKIA